MASALGLWRPENVALASDSSQIEQGGRHTGCSRRENAGAREKGWGKRAVPRAEIRRAWREERGRNQRAERGALAGKTDLPARPRERVRPRRREKLLPASLRLKNRLLLPFPSSPSARGAAAGGLLFPRRLLWSSIEQDTSRLLQSSLEQDLSRPPQVFARQVITLLCIFLLACSLFS